MQEGMIEVKERHAFVVFFKTDESGFVPVGQVRPFSQNLLPARARAVVRLPLALLASYLSEKYR